MVLVIIWHLLSYGIVFYCYFFVCVCVCLCMCLCVYVCVQNTDINYTIVLGVLVRTLTLRTYTIKSCTYFVKSLEYVSSTKNIVLLSYHGDVLCSIIF